MVNERVEAREYRVAILNANYHVECSSGFALSDRLPIEYDAESTVGEYFEHLYAEVGVRHRSALFARVFAWSQSVY